MALPNHPIVLMNQVYRKVLPTVHEALNYWKQRAAEIPNKELRGQALASIAGKTFHVEGGSILALAAHTNRHTAIRFIVAYQTISDYLDNLCDRSTSLDPEDFAALHESMEDACTVGAPPREYYRFREDQEDGNYLVELMKECQSVLKDMPHYEKIKPDLLELCRYYCDLQVHKHVRKDEREDRLIALYEKEKSKLPDMTWFEFAACSGSTLGIFCLVSYGLQKDFESRDAMLIRKGYFPYIQGLHILLDYFIDQEEDRVGGDLNFCFYYVNKDELYQRLLYFLEQADIYIAHLPDQRFHRMILRGLLGIYLSDEKVSEQKEVKLLAKKMMRKGGRVSRFFYWNNRFYQWFQKTKKDVS